METFVMRYIVPFAYKKAKKGSAYDALNKCLDQNANWENIQWDKGEQDCYEYLKQLYPKYEDDYVVQNGVGTIWEYRGKNSPDPLLPTIVYKDEKVSEKTIWAKVSEAGLFVLKNGIGLFWYETEFFEPGKKKNQEPKIDLEHLIFYQNEIKELAKTEHNYQLEFTGEIRLPGDTIEPGNTEETRKEEKKFLEAKALKFCKSSIEDIAEFKLRKNLRIKNSKSNEEEIVLGYHVKSDMPLGCWIHQMLSFPGCEIEYYPGRKRTNSEENICYKIADKAILYQYIVADIGHSQLESLTYCLTHGYKRSYVMPENIRERMYEPFGNIIWYAEKEGCGIYANYNADNATFLLETMKTRVCNDYFFMYMNLLQQSYVILNLAEEIATTFSMSEKDYQSGNRKTGKKLEDIQMRINVFLIKCTHASVSHIGHHNAFYEYVEKNLLIKEDIENLREGLDSLDEIQRRHEDDKVTIGLGVLSVFAILAAFGDAEHLIDMVMAGSPLINTFKTVVYAIIGIIFLLVVIALKDTHIEFLEIAFNEIKGEPRRPRKKTKNKIKKHKK